MRQWAQFIAFAGPAGFLLLCGYIDDIYVACTCLVFAQVIIVRYKQYNLCNLIFCISLKALLGASQSGLGCAFLDISPYYSPRYNTIGNALAAAGGIFSPIVVSSFISQYPGSEGWRAIFILTAVMSAGTLALWSIFQTSTPVVALNTPGEIVK